MEKSLILQRLELYYDIFTDAKSMKRPRNIAALVSCVIHFFSLALCFANLAESWGFLNGALEKEYIKMLADLIPFYNDNFIVFIILAIVTMFIIPSIIGRLLFSFLSDPPINKNTKTDFYDDEKTAAKAIADMCKWKSDAGGLPELLCVFADVVFSVYFGIIAGRFFTGLLLGVVMFFVSIIFVALTLESNLNKCKDWKDFEEKYKEFDEFWLSFDEEEKARREKEEKKTTA